MKRIGLQFNFYKPHKYWSIQDYDHLRLRTKSFSSYGIKWKDCNIKQHCHILPPEVLDISEPKSYHIKLWTQEMVIQPFWKMEDHVLLLLLVLLNVFFMFNSIIIAGNWYTVIQNCSKLVKIIFIMERRYDMMSIALTRWDMLIVDMWERCSMCCKVCMYTCITKYCLKQLLSMPFYFKLWCADCLMYRWAGMGLIASVNICRYQLYYSILYTQNFSMAP